MKELTKAEAKKRIEKLREVINYHRYLYHVLDKQEISDAALDSLKRELYKLEQQYPDLITPDSPTQRVAGRPLDKFRKVEHRTPMLSIEDVSSQEELFQWQSYLKRLEPSADLEYFCELKIDGFAIALIYEKGVLVCGATRGDGKTGEDVTQNIKTIESIPLKLQSLQGTKGINKDLEQKLKEGRIEVRGEVYMDKRSFQKTNKERIKKGEPPYANPRNLAAGSIRQLDSKLVVSRDLKFLAYDIISGITSVIHSISHSQEHQMLSCLGFKTEKGKICKNLQEVISFWEEAQKKRDSLPFQIDGVVVLINNNALFERLGIVGKSPRAIRAFKFSAKQATTRIKDIKIQVGRTGVVTPVAILEPVMIGGATITRATLHNEDEIKRLEVKIGDTVIIERAGDVIPAVAMVLKELRGGNEKSFYFPKECPVCGAKLIKPQEEVIWRCPNPDCPARKKEFLEHFVSKKAFNIEGLGPKILEQLINQGLISQPLDIFDLKEGDLLPLERFAEKSAQNLIEAIQSKKEITLPRLIFALGIRNVGEETAQDLAEYFGSIDPVRKNFSNGVEKLKDASLEELQKVKDIGPVVGKSIYQWFHQKRNLEFLEKLEKAGIEIQYQKSKIKNQKLRGLTFVLTGSLETMTREEIKEKIQLLGGGISESVSKKTDYLILGKEPGSKYERAKKLGVRVINEKEFLAMLK